MTSPTFPAIRTPVMEFRGGRTYVHSTDLYTELMTAARELGLTLGGPVDLRIKRAITTQVEFHFDGEVESAEIGIAAARFAISTGDRTVFGRIIATDRSVTDRKPYDERRIWNRARIDGRSVKISSDSGCAPIEVITALGVLLHNTTLKPPEGRRWLLTRLSFDRPLREADAVEMTVVIANVIGGTKTRSSLAAADGVIGSMDFAVGTIPLAGVPSA